MDGNLANKLIAIPKENTFDINFIGQRLVKVTPFPYKFERKAHYFIKTYKSKKILLADIWYYVDQRYKECLYSKNPLLNCRLSILDRKS